MYRYAYAQGPPQKITLVGDANAKSTHSLTNKGATYDTDDEHINTAHDNDNSGTYMQKSYACVYADFACILSTHWVLSNVHPFAVYDGVFVLLLYLKCISAPLPKTHADTYWHTHFPFLGCVDNEQDAGASMSVPASSTSNRGSAIASSRPIRYRRQTGAEKEKDKADKLDKHAGMIFYAYGACALRTSATFA